MKTLFDATTLGGIQLKNRLVRSATGDGLATDDGRPSEAHFALYEELAAGGVALIVLGFTGVSEQDPFIHGEMRLSNDALIPEYARLVDRIHRQGARVMPQLALGIFQREFAPGCYRSISVNEMTKVDIDTVVQRFIDAANRAKQAGFDGVQLHGCHKVLLSEFLRPKRNQRTDAYGCSAEGRSRIVAEIIRGIRKQLGNFHISIKLNNTDMPLGECVETCKILEQAGLDSIEMEWLYPQLHEAMRHSLDVPIILTSEHRDPDEMEKLMEEGVDYFAMSRPLLREPDLPKRWQAGDRCEARCISCDRCLIELEKGCAFRPRL